MVRIGLRVDDSGMTFVTKAVILLIVFAVVSAVYVNVIAYQAPISTASTRIAEMKDTVRISYIGYFEDGHVFDTSIEAVADDNATWPKALSFTARSTYSDFTFVVGKTSCAAGETDCAIIGMTHAVLGLSEGSIVTATIAPENGYGSKDPDLVSVGTIYQQVPVRVAMNLSSFASKYRTAPQDGILVQDPFWGWPAIVHLSGGMIIVENSPDIAEISHLYQNQTRGGEWYATVEGIDDAANNGTGAITVLNKFVFTAGKKLLVKDTSGDLYVTDNEDGTYTVDKNREVVGVNLVFRITVLGITKAS